MNRIGDLGLILGVILIYTQFHSLNYSVIFANTSISPALLNTITLLLVVGAIGKSAQIPLYTWLPDAMAGPTPVSALIHAATMVTAGIYLIIRCNVLFAMATLTNNIIIIIGLATSILAAVIALKQNDIKKVLAYSTVSQLGLMFFALGLGAYSAALFHLTTHAFFKALLFLCAGSVIHALHGEQNILKMGGLKSKIPITYYCFLIGTLAISGIPPFSGFFSKDEILIAAFANNPALWLFAVVISLFTIAYNFRLFYLTFYGSYRGENQVATHIHESPKIMTIPLIILAFLSTIGGVLNVSQLFGGSESITRFISSQVKNLSVSELSHSTEWLIIALTLTFIFIVIFVIRNKYQSNRKNKL